MTTTRRFSPFRFAKSLIISKVQRQVVDFAEGLGEKRVQWMVQNNVPISSIIPKEVQAQYRSVAAQWKWAADAISDQDFVDMLPQWTVKVMIDNGEKGKLWLEDLIAWLRSMFEEDKNVTKAV